MIRCQESSSIGININGRDAYWWRYLYGQPPVSMGINGFHQSSCSTQKKYKHCQFFHDLSWSEIIGKMRLQFKNHTWWHMRHEPGWPNFTYSRRLVSFVKQYRFFFFAISQSRQVSVQTRNKEKRKNKKIKWSCVWFSIQHWEPCHNL